MKQSSLVYQAVNKGEIFLAGLIATWFLTHRIARSTLTDGELWIIVGLGAVGFVCWSVKCAFKEK